ncbi:hypothetical protein [Streptomyces sp. ODS28]|uniref:hypothetical protein n=1 Tax=Streptomyces sp. ODS28 TaxID=3136688 RepID=UPI0031E68AF6
MSADLLEPYRPHMTRPQEYVLAQALLDWTQARCVCRRDADWHAKRAFSATVFAIECRPADATWQESLPAGKYLVFFFNADDGSTDELAQLTEQLRRGSATTAGELGCLYRGLLADLHARQLDTSRLEADIARICATADTEDQHDPATMTESQFSAVRQISVHGPAYIGLWALLRGLRLSGAEGLVSQAIEAIYLANDLASWKKESVPGAESACRTSNFVLFHAARSAGGIPAACDAAVTRYNHLTDTFATLRPSPLVALLAGIVDGNLRGHRRLTSTRYHGAEQYLRRLHRISARPAPRSPASMTYGPSMA